MKPLKLVFALLLFLLPLTVCQADITNGLIAFYPFNGSASNVIADAYHGTVVGAAPGSDRSNQTTASY